MSPTTNEPNKAVNPSGGSGTCAFVERFIQTLHDVAS